jgi:hypothetical protein
LREAVAGRFSTKIVPATGGMGIMVIDR